MDGIDRIPCSARYDFGGEAQGQRFICSFLMGGDAQSTTFGFLINAPPAFYPSMFGTPNKIVMTRRIALHAAANGCLRRLEPVHVHFHNTTSPSVGFPWPPFSLKYGQAAAG
jgi:hypothetical protein